MQQQCQEQASGLAEKTADLERYTTQQIYKDIHRSVLSFSAVLPFHNHTAKHEAQESVFHITLRKSSPASFCSASSYWRTRFCPRSCSEKFSTWDAEFCAIKHPCLPPAQWGLRTQLSLALAHGSPVHTSSPLHTSCRRCLVLTKHRPVLLLPLLSAWFGVSELKKKKSHSQKSRWQNGKKWIPTCCFCHKNGCIYWLNRSVYSKTGIRHHICQPTIKLYFINIWENMDIYICH